MIPIYKAISYQESFTMGTTKPILAIIENESGNFEEYVVKLFNLNQLNSYSPVNKEIYACVLASEFDLSSPDFALIEFNDSFIKSLDANDQTKVSQLNTRLFFGSKYIANPMPYSSTLSKAFLKTYNYEEIFAFDVLLRNVDRTFKKPNILFSGQEYYIIDHEQTLLVDRTFSEYVKNEASWNFITRPTKGDHIFHSILKEKRHNHSFDTFFEYLIKINIDSLVDYYYELEKYGFEDESFGCVYDYLSDAKKNPTKLQKLLLTLLQ